MDIRRTRIESGLTQEQLIDGFPNMDKSLLSKIENRHAEATEAFLRHIFNKVGYLYTDCGEMVKKCVATSLHAKLESILYSHIGEKNAIQREQLSDALGMSDRKTRQVIEELQRSGLEIVNMSNGAGYYIAANKREADRYIRQERSRRESGMLKTLFWEC